MIDEDTWKEFKADEAYGLYADLKDEVNRLNKRVDGVLEENYFFVKSLRELTRLVDEVWSEVKELKERGDS